MLISKCIFAAGLSVAIAMPLAANAGTFTTLHTFTGADGSYPEGPLLYYNGALYGTASGQGINNENGNVFKVNAETGNFAVVYGFKGGTDGSIPSDGVVYQGGMLYGTTAIGGGGCGQYGCGTIFSINLQTSAESVLYNFSQTPGFAALVYLAGTLYGTTYFGGVNNAGSVSPSIQRPTPLLHNTASAVLLA